MFLGSVFNHLSSKIISFILFLQTSTSKPNYNDDDKEYDEEEEPASGVELVENNSPSLNWNQNQWGQPSWNPSWVILLFSMPILKCLPAGPSNMSMMHCPS